VRSLSFVPWVLWLAVGSAARAQSYRIDDGERFVRADASGETSLRTLEGREAGTLRGWCAHLAGTAFVAADGGLFLASRESNVLDRIDLEGLPPPGRPVGVAPVDDERIWLLTSEALCAVGTRQFIWRRVDLGFDAPAEPFTALAVEPDGALRLFTSTGSRRFEPAQDPPPRVRVVRIDGEPYDARAVLAKRSGNALRVELELSDGAEARWRNADRFRWLEFGDEASIAAQLPGRQNLRVVAFDDELRRSAPVSIALDVAYPEKLDPRRLVVLAGVVAALTIGGAVALSLLRRERPKRLAQAAGLAVLTLCLGAQLVAAVFPHAKGWPFLGFSMYTKTSAKDAVSYRQEFFGVRADGARLPLSPPGGSYGKYEAERALQRFVHDEDDARESFLTRWNQEHPAQPLVGLLGLCQRRRLRPEGPIDAPALVFFDTTPKGLE